MDFNSQHLRSVKDNFFEGIRLQMFKIVKAKNIQKNIQKTTIDGANRSQVHRINLIVGNSEKQKLWINKVISYILKSI